MKKLILGTVLATFLASGSASVAQIVVWDANPDQEREVYTTVTREPVRRPPPAGFSVRIGDPVAADVDLYDMPGTIKYEPARRYRYTTYENRVYVIDPNGRKVVKIIER